jgi:hypothetical protein
MKNNTIKQITPQQKLAENYQVLYTSSIIRDGTRMNMLHFAVSHFMRTCQFQNYKLLKEISELYPTDAAKELTRTPEFHQVMFSTLMDNIAFGITVENYLKSELLNRGYLIHVINNQPALESLWKKQEEEPVLFSELISESPLLTIGGKRYSDGSPFEKTKGLTDKTVSMSKLLKYSNKVDLGINESMRAHFKRQADDRNTLHYLYELTFRISDKWLATFNEFITLVNEKMIFEHNYLSSKFHGIGSKYEIKSIVIL